MGKFQLGVVVFSTILLQLPLANANFNTVFLDDAYVSGSSPAEGSLRSHLWPPETPLLSSKGALQICACSCLNYFSGVDEAKDTAPCVWTLFMRKRSLLYQFQLEGLFL